MIERFTEMELAAFACDQWGYLAPEYTVGGMTFAEEVLREGLANGLPMAFPSCDIRDAMTIQKVYEAIIHWVECVSFYQGKVDYRMASYIQNC